MGCSFDERMLTGGAILARIGTLQSAEKRRNLLGVATLVVARVVPSAHEKRPGEGRWRIGVTGGAVAGGAVLSCR
jgi:hypothetical protein